MPGFKRSSTTSPISCKEIEGTQSSSHLLLLFNSCSGMVWAVATSSLNVKSVGVFFVLYSYVYIYAIICANVRNIWEIFWASDQAVNYLLLCRFLLLPLHRLKVGSTNIWPCTALNCLVLPFNSHHHLSNKINQEFVHCLSTWDGNMRSISIWPLQIVHTLHAYVNIENRESTPSRSVIIICTSSESFLKNGIWSQALLCLQFKHCRQKRLCKAYARPRQRPWQV